VEKLQTTIKVWLDISENITLRRGNDEVLGLETPIFELYNQENEALEVIVESQIELEHLSLCLIFVFKYDLANYDYDHSFITRSRERERRRSSGTYA
jgi:hypothetical protein